MACPPDRAPRGLPPQPTGVCLHCAITFRPPMSLPLVDGEVLHPKYVQLSCPSCGRMVQAIGDPPRAKIHADIVTVIREADLSADDLDQLRRVLASADADASPRAIAEEFPAASQIVVVASRAGKDWIALLGLIVTVFSLALAGAAIVIQHDDAEEALRSADKAAQVERTSQLTDEDVAEIAARIAAELKKPPVPGERDGEQQHGDGK